jgi:hypothetical protein
MRKLMPLLLAALIAAGLLSQTAAQPPGGNPAQDPSKAKQKDYSNSSIVVRMMAFDKNKDGKLTKDEVTDERLHRLFDRADANKDGVVTKEELMALAAQMEAEIGQGGGPGGRGPGGPGGRGPGGPGGPGRGGPGGPGGGGRGGFGGPPQPGQILPSFVQERLNLTAEQKKQLEELQKEVDGKLGQILTEAQQKQLKEMQQGGGRGGPGGRGPGGGPRGGGGGPPPSPDETRRPG